MEMLNAIIQVISIDFDLNNNSSPVDLSSDKIYLNNIKTKGLNQIEESNGIKLKEKDLTKVVYELLNLFKDWKSSIEFIESNCATHDFKDVHYNGYRTIFKINTLAIKRINKILIKRDLTVKHLIKSIALARILTKINNKIKEFYEKGEEYSRNLNNNNEDENHNTDESKNDKVINQLNNRKPFNSKNLFPSTVSVSFFEFYQELEEDLVDYFRYHSLFHFRKGLRRSARAVLALLSTSSNIPSSLIFNSKKKSKALAKSLNNPTLSFPFSVLDQIDCRTYNDIFVPLKYFGEKISTSTVYIPRQYKFILNDINTCLNSNQFLIVDHNWSYNHLINSKSSKNFKKEKIRVRILKDKATPKNGVVMFHVHGGAFVFHSPECHEAYLREFAKKLPDVVIISVAYRTRQEYPKAQQDVLDAYLWLTSGSEDVKEVIGFEKIDKIICVGDSAGAFFNFSLVHLLMDFNKEIEKENLLDKTLRYPDALFNFYGFYNLTNTSPALFNCCLDFILPPSHMKIAFGSLVHGVEKPKFGKRIFFPWFVDKKKRWYNSASLIDITNEMINVFETIPYLSSLHNFDFNSMKIPLYLVSSEMDLCLDHNIDLANKWKGEVSMLIIEDMVHGFLQLEEADKTIKEDIFKCCNFLRNAVDKLKN